MMTKNMLEAPSTAVAAHPADSLILRTHPEDPYRENSLSIGLLSEFRCGMPMAHQATLKRPLAKGFRSLAECLAPARFGLLFIARARDRTIITVRFYPDCTVARYGTSVSDKTPCVEEVCVLNIGDEKDFTTHHEAECARMEERLLAERPDLVKPGAPGGA